MSRWRTYEKLVYYYYCNFCKQYSNEWEVTYDSKIRGHSGRSRQIDILMKSELQYIIKVIDCKCYKSVIDIKHVESIIGMLDDLRANAGVIVSPNGFSKTAYERAKDYGRLELVTLNLSELFPYRFYYNQRVDIRCPNCYGKKDVFSNDLSKSIVNITSYNIVYSEDKNKFVKINTGFCNECMNMIFHCGECNTDTCISVDDVSKKIIKRCKCGIGYSFYSFIDENGNEQITHGYFDENGNELLCESNIYYMYNKYGIQLDTD
ncbi:restriction endonuclease [Clostridium botulinum]|uniref:restriction endonuclease n=1 Tax=Clostridium botulinum TaxID=1491 RepID=UPI0007736860|nr:restriction endonuclease [Clostridium botulinum]MBY6930896.1 restriction endonuclease [Clostridium botulinum]